MWTVGQNVLSKFTSDTKDRWVAHTPASFATIEGDLIRLENRTKSNFMQLDIVLHLGRHNPYAVYTVVMEK